jgi:flagellar biosynthetic protein FliO
MELLQQALALFVVFALLGTALWFVRTRQSPDMRARGGRRMQILERVALTPQHTLCLVKVDDRLLMIGTAPSHCRVIQTMEDRQ